MPTPLELIASARSRHFGGGEPPPDPVAAVLAELERGEWIMAGALIVLELERQQAEANPRRRPGSTDKAEPFPVRYFFDRLCRTVCELEGSDPARLTEAGTRKIRNAVAAIQRVKADLHPDDLIAAAGAFKKLFPTQSLTARLLVEHWAKLVGNRAVAAAVKLVEDEPPCWREWINQNTPDAPFAAGNHRAGAQWSDLDASYRRYLTAQCQQAQHRPAA